MKDTIKRIICVILGALVVFGAFTLITKCSVKVSYKYLTYENEWGISKDCYIQEDQKLVCEIDNGLISVKQYYEEEK